MFLKKKQEPEVQIEDQSEFQSVISLEEARLSVPLASEEDLIKIIAADPELRDKLDEAA